MDRFTLGNTDLKKIGTGILVAEAGAILTTALIWLQSGTTDWRQLLMLEEAVILSTLVNTLRKILDGEVNAK